MAGRCLPPRFGIWFPRYPDVVHARKEPDIVIVLGVILILVGYLLPVPGIIATIGWILLAIGLVLLVLGQTGRPVGGRRYWY
jgi:protein-S-isoprenylcysteine O-methyltransferase Ste14